MNMQVDEKKAKETLEKGFGEAKVILQDEDRVERLLQRAEKKFRAIPRVGRT